DSAGGDTDNNGATGGSNGDWNRIEFAAGSTGNQLNHVQVRYGGGYGAAGAVTIAGGALTLSNSVVRNSYTNAVLARGGNATLTSDVLAVSFGSGLRVESGATVSVVNATIDGNNVGISADSGAIGVSNSLITFENQGISKQGGGTF